MDDLKPFMDHEKGNYMIRKESLLIKDSNVGFSVPLNRGPYQNNGASPWYAFVGVGTLPQTLKFSFDTGSDFIWVTSSLCAPDSCVHYGGEQFNYESSSSWSWINKKTIDVNFGPWGNMDVKTGNDQFTLTSSASIEEKPSLVCLTSDLYLAESYEGIQFQELDWDGGIGIPSLMQSSDLSSYRSYRGLHTQCEDKPGSFHFFQSLVERGVIHSDSPYVTFLTDIDTKAGCVDFGQLNSDYQESREYLFLPWDEYAVPYLWTSKITSLSMGGVPIISPNTALKTPYYFALDTGASQFKGGAALMSKLKKVAEQTKGELVIEVGKTDTDEVGKLIVTSSMYDVLIEEGKDKGSVIAQFEPMEGVDYLALVGSVLMDHLYSVYEFSINYSDGEPIILPIGMWIFNKNEGPKVLTTVQKEPARIFSV